MSTTKNTVDEAAAYAAFKQGVADRLKARGLDEKTANDLFVASLAGLAEEAPAQPAAPVDMDVKLASAIVAAKNRRTAGK